MEPLIGSEQGSPLGSDEGSPLGSPRDDIDRENSERKRLRLQLALSGAFAYVNGWIDAISLRRYKAFVTMMVGNTLTMGNSVGDFFSANAEPDRWLVLYRSRSGSTNLEIPDPLLYILLIFTFMAGVALCRLLELKRGWSARHFAPLVVFCMVFNDVFEALNRLYFHGCEADNSDRLFINSPKLAALRLAPVFGIQDAICVKGGLAALPWCTTGNVVNLAYHTVDKLTGHSHADRTKHLNRSTVMLSCMSVGAISGACFEVWRRKSNDGCQGGDYGIMVMAPVLGILFWCHDILYRPVTFRQRKKPAKGLSKIIMGSFPNLLNLDK